MIRSVEPSDVVAPPRITATARLREVWDTRLRESEREFILQHAGIDPHFLEIAPTRWAALDGSQQARILISLRDLVTLGNEAAYALGYSRRMHRNG